MWFRHFKPEIKKEIIQWSATGVSWPKKLKSIPSSGKCMASFFGCVQNNLYSLRGIGQKPIHDQFKYMKRNNDKSTIPSDMVMPENKRPHLVNKKQRFVMILNHPLLRLPESRKIKFELLFDFNKNQFLHLKNCTHSIENLQKKNNIS